MYKVNYAVNNEEYEDEFSTIEDIVEAFVTDEYIDECIDTDYDCTIMFSHEFLASEIIKIDEVAYQEALNYYTKKIIRDLKQEIIEGEMKKPVLFLEMLTITPIV